MGGRKGDETGNAFSSSWIHRERWVGGWVEEKKMSEVKEETHHQAQRDGWVGGRVHEQNVPARERG